MEMCRCSKCDENVIILGLEKPSSFRELDDAHRDLVKVWHPDRFENDVRLRGKAEEEFKRIQAAYSELKEHRDRAADEAFVRMNSTATSASPPPPKVESEPRSEQTRLFAVSTPKLITLSILTFGIYELYWFYRNWKSIKVRANATYIQPFWRAVFPVFFCYRCFAYIVAQDDTSNLAMARLLALGWILTQVAWKLPDPFWIFSFLSGFFLLPIQVKLNRIDAREHPLADRNSTFSLWNWLTSVIGAVVVILALVGTFMPDHK